MPGHKLVDAVTRGNLIDLIQLRNEGFSLYYLDDKYHQTLLHYAALHGHNDIIVYLLKNTQIPVDKRKKSEKTALHVAATFGHASTVRILLDHGADANATDDQGKTPLCFAVRMNHAECVRLLVKAGALVKSPIVEQAIRDALDFNKVILRDTTEVEAVLSEAFIETDILCMKK